MSFYHSPDQINAMTPEAAAPHAAQAHTYAYYYPDLSPLPPLVPQYLPRVKTPDRKALIGEWLSNHRRIEGDNGWWNWEGSRTFVFVDGHAEYRDARSLRAAMDGWPDPNLTVDGSRGADVD